jgi:hypothetical protein
MERKASADKGADAEAVLGCGLTYGEEHAGSKATDNAFAMDLSRKTTSFAETWLIQPGPASPQRS